MLYIDVPQGIATLVASTCSDFTFFDTALAAKDADENTVAGTTTICADGSTNGETLTVSGNLTSVKAIELIGRNGQQGGAFAIQVTCVQAPTESPTLRPSPFPSPFPPPNPMPFSTPRPMPQPTPFPTPSPTDLPTAIPTDSGADFGGIAPTPDTGW